MSEQDDESSDEDIYGPDDNGKFADAAMHSLLEYDDSLLTTENQEVSRAVRDCTHEQLCQIAHSAHVEGGDEDDEEEDSGAGEEEESSDEGGMMMKMRMEGT